MIYEKILHRVFATITNGFGDAIVNSLSVVRLQKISSTAVTRTMIHQCSIFHNDRSDFVNGWNLNTTDDGRRKYLHVWNIIFMEDTTQTKKL